MRYRSFLNCDPPAIAEIWHSQPPTRGLIQSTTSAMLELVVFAKPYFDRQGFILAIDDDRPVGFVHAGWGANEDLSQCSSASGATCMLMVVPGNDHDTIADELLARSEQYLCQAGAQQLYGGEYFPVNPFYLGMYGGSEMPGILCSDESNIALYRRHGYEEIAHRLVLHRRLSDFRPAVDRRQMLIRRRYDIKTTIDPPTASWWEACTVGGTDRTRFSLCERNGDQQCGSVTYWDMEPLASSWGVHAVGLFQLEVPDSFRQQGLATMLVGESLKQLLSQGISLVEVHISRDDSVALGLYKKLGFELVDESIVFCKKA